MQELTKIENKETFRKTEGELYGYFRDLKEIELLEIDRGGLQDQEESIQWDIKHCMRMLSPDTAI